MTAKQEMQKEQEKLQRAVALEIVKQYCVDNKLSWDKLQNQQFYWICGEAFFAQPSSIEPKGLLNDKETMPMPTLIIKMIGERLMIEQTEYTHKYLSA